MKRVLIFFGLKVKEIGKGLLIVIPSCIGFILALCSVCIFFEAIKQGEWCCTVFPCWISVCLVVLGAIIILAVLMAAVLAVSSVIICWVQDNWRKAGELAQKQ